MIRLVDHDPGWSGVAESLMSDLAREFGHFLARIDHVGSTAVPGLAAKPKLHIDVILQKGTRPEVLRDRLLTFGYTDHGYRFRRDEIQMTRATARPSTPAIDALSGGTLSHRLCLCRPDCRAAADRRRFRDALRRDVALAAEYGRLKHRLAAAHGDPSDWESYNAGKSAFIGAVLSKNR
jgi:GrpB-like predicted nucleotidyltransferase (UPF0157 family)